MSATVPRRTRSSGWVARYTTTTGQPAPYADKSSSMRARVRVIAKCSTRVARVAANAASDSVSGIAVERAWVRVSTTDCATSGTVSSRPTRAAAAAQGRHPRADRPRHPGRVESPSLFRYGAVQSRVTRHQADDPSAGAVRINDAGHDLVESQVLGIDQIRCRRAAFQHLGIQIASRVEDGVG